MRSRCISALIALLALLEASANAYAAGGDATGDANQPTYSVMGILFFCGCMGTLGQAARVIVGLKTLADYNSPADAQVLFSLARLIVSLIIGFVAGVVVAMGYWATAAGLTTIHVEQFNSMINFAIAGYIGTDIVEAFTTKFFEPNSSTALSQLIPGDQNTSLSLGPQYQKPDLGPLFR